MMNNDAKTSSLAHIENLIPSLSIDCVIVGFKNQELHVLTMKLKGADLNALPGGFVRHHENLDQAALRTLKERTGLTVTFLEQFYTFSDVNRGKDKRIEQHLNKANLLTPGTKIWMQQRFISTAYLALVEMNQCDLKPDLLSEKCEWYPMNNLPHLLFDHNTIITKALEHLKVKIRYLPIGIALLPHKFTMKEIQSIYEFILNKKLDRANFQKKILRLGFLIRHEKQLSGGAHKAPYLYSFDRKKYNLLVENGIGFI